MTEIRLGKTPLDGVKPSLSFEFFPPKTDKAEAQLWSAIDRLAPFGPRFVSVTYGALGTTRDRTHATVAQIQRRTGVPAAAHLTCVGHSREELATIADAYWMSGIRHIVALRGDAPGDLTGQTWKPHADGFLYASDLVAFLKSLHPFEISVACFPEKHPQARDEQAELDNLKRKIDAGATRAISQFFFDPSVFLRFRDKAAAAGIATEIVPGLLPITNLAKAKEFAKSCGTSVPAWLDDLFHGLENDSDTRSMVAASVALEQCRLMLTQGVRSFHFYTLNRFELSAAICRMLGVKQSETPAQASLHAASL